MTVTHATTTQPLLRDVRFARARRGVCEAGGQAVWKGIGVTTITEDDMGRRGWRAPVTRPSSRQPAASLVVGPFKPQ
jgi:hypothetical protein